MRIIIPVLSTCISVTLLLYSQECENWQSDHPEWIFCDDFESDDPLVMAGRYFEYGNNDGDFKVVDNRPESTNPAIGFPLPQRIKQTLQRNSRFVSQVLIGCQ